MEYRFLQRDSKIRNAQFLNALLMLHRITKGYDKEYGIEFNCSKYEIQIFCRLSLGVKR